MSKNLNYNNMSKYKSFIPTHLFRSNIKAWVEINEEKKDYLNETDFGIHFEFISEVAPDLFYVDWKEEMFRIPTIYKGKLEYTDEYQLTLDAELKELSKDFKFKL